MILEDATREAFGYQPKELSRESAKPILAVCIECGKFRITTKHDYHYLCASCGHKENVCALGKTRTVEQKAKISEAHKGVISGMKGKHHTAKAKQKNGDAHRDTKNSNWRGGKREALKRYRKTEKGKFEIKKRLIKRRRHLGYTLIESLKGGEVGHHITDEYIIGIPAEVHTKFGGHSREKHRELVLEWLKNNDKEKYRVALRVLT